MTFVYDSKPTDGMSWWGTDRLNDELAMSKFIHDHAVAWVGEVCNPILDASSLVGGTGYVDNIYPDVPLTIKNLAAGALVGRDLLATVTVTGGAVTDVSITQKGSGFMDGDILTTANSNLGGAGSGFEITVQTADASVHLLQDFAKSTSSTTGKLFFGLERRGNGNSQMGWYYEANSSSTTHYDYSVYNFGASSSNSGYGSYSTNGTSRNCWYTGAGYQVFVAYESDPVKGQFFAFGDTQYRQTKGIVRLNRSQDSIYPGKDYGSEWCRLYSSDTSTSLSPIMNAYYTDSLLGYSATTWTQPNSNSNAIFKGFPVYAYTHIPGTVPPSLGTGKDNLGNPGDTMAISANEIYTLISGCCVARSTY